MYRGTMVTLLRGVCVCVGGWCVCTCTCTIHISLLSEVPANGIFFYVYEYILRTLNPEAKR